MFQIISKIYAQSLTTSQIGVKTSIGVISNVNNSIYWTLNTIRYFGWAFVIVGVAYAIFSIVYKLIDPSNEKAAATFQAGITKAVIVVVLGLIMVGSGIILNSLAILVGSSQRFNLDF